MQLNIITIKRNLENFVPKGQQKFERVIQLHEEVEKGLDQLCVINTAHTIAEDFQLVALLINKLPQDYQEEWDEAVIRQEQLGATSYLSLWQQFQQFLSTVSGSADPPAPAHLLLPSNDSQPYVCRHHSSPPRRHSSKAYQTP